MNSDKQQVLDRVNELTKEVKRLRANRKELKEGTGLRCPAELTQAIKRLNTEIEHLRKTFVSLVMNGGVQS